MFDTFIQFTDWINQWPTGKEVNFALNSIVGSDEVTGFIMKNVDHDVDPIYFFVTTDKIYIHGFYLIGQNETLQVKTYKLADLKSLQVNFSESIETLVNTKFKDKKFTFNFIGEEPVTFNTETRYHGDFNQLIKNLTKALSL